MKNLKIFPKMFLQTFGILGTVIVLIHLLVFFIFPRTYLETRKQELYAKADEISENIKGKDMKFVEQSLDFYSKSSDIKAVIKGQGEDNELQIGDDINVDLKSGNNSLIIEEREIELKDGKKISIQFISTADMKKDAKELSFKFLPYSLFISFIFSIIISLIYAKAITNNINEIKNVTKKMMRLDRTAYLNINSTNEVGELKEQINDLYNTLLKLIDDLELKNEEIVKLEKLKYDFFRGTSHELKTPLASLKIILENMKYNIGKYKNRDLYIDNCIDIVDHLTRSISQMLSVSSFEHLKDDEEIIVVNDILEDVLKQYILLANNRNIKVNNTLKDEKIYIGMTALKIVLSNLINNAVKYSDEDGVINIGTKDDWLYIENSYKDNKDLDVNKIFEINFNLNKENSNGLGLYIVKNILLNYGIKYKVEKTEIGIVFLIELSGNMDK
ncbi:HAMP domain-containing sensor histidine kinase [Parvimonas sp. D2]|uniref:sensor histidine kinase n=1 Tax=unclassified Parvimonas TaxID=1151464 RepID=UPI002B4AAC54|nr:MULTISPECIES: HAMP domain-containing sensor histidine kinase [unclassified Parvimonas]MEB3011902.1 HAMP domain-containing sensor histidine kinase [Parvimonas sp. D2]MEB3087666.1 HAMP domain-containing sensor histidine kinase [Parvimonas sp. D4]